MKTLAFFGLIVVATLSAMFFYPSVRSSGQRPATEIALSDPGPPMMTLEITDYSVEFRQPTSNQKE